MSKGMIRCNRWQACRETSCRHWGPHGPFCCISACCDLAGKRHSVRCKPIEEPITEKLQLPPTAEIYNQAMKRSEEIKEGIMKIEEKLEKYRKRQAKIIDRIANRRNKRLNRRKP